MAHGVCPWWLGYLLASPIRKWIQDPAVVLEPFVKEGMIVLEPGPGMGFFTLELARRVGPGGRVFAIDVQTRMVSELAKRARKAGLIDRIEARPTKGERLGIDDLVGKVDFALAFAMVHEAANPAMLLADISLSLKAGGKLLLVEPRGHVPDEEFATTLEQALEAGMTLESKPQIRRSHATLLVRK